MSNQPDSPTPRTDWPDARIGDLAQDQRDFRQESSDQHRRLEQKITDLGEAFDRKMDALDATVDREVGEVVKSIQADKDSKAEKWRWYLLSGAVPVLLLLLGKLLAP